MRCIMIIGILALLLSAPICGSEVQAAVRSFYLTENIDYDITVQLSEGIISKIKNIRVFGTVEIASKVFLVVELQNNLRIDKSLIALDSVKTILPSNTSHDTLISDSSLK